METNIVRSRKDRKRDIHPKNQAKKSKKPRIPGKAEQDTVDAIDDEEMQEPDVPDFDSEAGSNSEGEEEEEADLSDYDMEDVSDDASDDDSDEEGLNFSDDDDSDDAGLYDELSEGCKVVSVEEAEKLVKDANNLKEANVRRLILVYGSFIRLEVLKQYPSSEKTPSGKDATKEKGARKKQAKRTMASRELSDKFRNSTNRYAPSSVDVYNYVALETFSVMEAYLKSKELSFQNRGIVDVVIMFRGFLSSALVQLGFHYEDIDLCRCALNILGNDTVIPWVITLKRHHKELVKVTCSILAYHSERSVRVYAFQLLQSYARSLDESRYHRILISQSPSSGMMVERLSKEQVKDFRNRSLNFMLGRSYRTQISAASVGRTLKNYGLFKLTQNCLAELYNEMPTDHLYTFAFKSIRDLAINVRTEWIAINRKKKRAKKTPDKKSSHSIVLPVYSWGFLEAINIWVAVLSKCKDRIEELCYPLVVVMNSAIKTKLPHKEYLPFILHMLTAQNQLANGVERFIPMISLIFNLMEQLKHKDLRKMKRLESKTTRKLLDNADDIMVRLKLSKKQLHASETYKTIYRYIALVLTDHVGLISLHPSFPEFIIPILANLKRYLNENQVEPEFRDSLIKLKKLMKESAEVIKEKRNELDLSKIGLPGLRCFAKHAKRIPIYQHRVSMLMKYQHISKEKVEGTLSAAQL